MISLEGTSPFDVLKGREKAAKNNKGSVRLKCLISQYNDEYWAADHKSDYMDAGSKRCRETIKREILQTIVDEGGVFRERSAAGDWQIMKQKEIFTLLCQRFKEEKDRRAKQRLKRGAVSTTTKSKSATQSSSIIAKAASTSDSCSSGVLSESRTILRPAIVPSRTATAPQIQHHNFYEDEDLIDGEDELEDENCGPDILAFLNMVDRGVTLSERSALSSTSIDETNTISRGISNRSLNSQSQRALDTLNSMMSLFSIASSGTQLVGDEHFSWGSNMSGVLLVEESSAPSPTRSHSPPAQGSILDTAGFFRMPPSSAVESA